MITSTGKDILAKYMIGQASSYASHIAVGCGKNPVTIDHTFTTQELAEFHAKKSLDFEMFRIPIISRGYVTEDGVAKVVFTAELPSEERYEITELGIYSAGSNPSVGPYGSKILQTFSNESWLHHKVSPAQEIAIPAVYSPLDDGYNDNDIHTSSPGDPLYGITVFQTNADNRVFADSTRMARYERCRFLNNIIAIPGNDATISVQDGHLVPSSSSNHIHLLRSSLDLNNNSPDDELRLAFSVINKNVDDPDPDRVKIILEFSSSDVFGDTSSQYARFEVDIAQGTSDGQNDFATNRYIVDSKTIQQLYKTSGFTWNAVKVVKIYSSVEVSGTPSANYYVCLDSLRLESVSSANPLYGMTGYSVIKNNDAKTIVKLANTTNFVEFRFAMGVS